MSITENTRQTPNKRICGDRNVAGRLGSVWKEIKRKTHPILRAAPEAATATLAPNDDIEEMYIYWMIYERHKNDGRNQQTPRDAAADAVDT